MKRVSLKIFSINHSIYVQNFCTQTNLPSSISHNPLQTEGSNCKKSDFHQFYDNIIKDVMSDFSFRDSQNPKFHCLYQKASLLAALSLANSTKSNYGKAWVCFLNFCNSRGYNPMETSSQDIANWLVYRSEHTKSPNVLEGNFKATKCF